MSNKVLIGIVVAVFVIAGMAIILTRPKSTTTSSSVSPSASVSPATSSSPTASATPSASPTTGASTTVTYTASGFSPRSTTVKSGGTVTFTNGSSAAIQVNSDSHPEHTDNNELNVGQIAPGQSKTVTLTKTGSFGIHNHLNASMTATVVVQ